MKLTRSPTVTCWKSSGCKYGFHQISRLRDAYRLHSPIKWAAVSYAPWQWLQYGLSSLSSAGLYWLMLSMCSVQWAVRDGIVRGDERVHRRRWTQHRDAVAVHCKSHGKVRHYTLPFVGLRVDRYRCSLSNALFVVWFIRKGNWSLPQVVELAISSFPFI